MDITDGFTTLPNASMRESFDIAIRHSQNYMNEIFFKTKSGKCWFGNVDYTPVRNELATYLITKCLTKVSHSCLPVRFSFSYVMICEA